MNNNENHRFDLRFYFVVFVWLTGFSWCALADQYPDFDEIEASPDRVEVDEAGKINFTLVQGDYFNGARAMMRETLPPQTNKNEWVYYSFGLDFTRGWPIDDRSDALIVQWRNGKGRPYCSIHLRGSEIVVKKNNPVEKWLHKANTNSVNEVLVNAIWSEQANGRLMVWVNGDIVSDYSGPTLNNNDKKPFVSFGIYRPQWNELDNPENKLSLVFTHFEFGSLVKSKKNFRLSDQNEVSSPSQPVTNGGNPT